jgi:hypothetical protein
MKRSGIIYFLISIVLIFSNVWAMENEEEKLNTEKAMTYWNEIKNKHANELDALKMYFGKYSEYGQFVPEVERLLIKHMWKNKKVEGGRFVLSNVKIDSWQSLTAVTITESPGGNLKMKGTQGGNILGAEAIHRWKGIVRDVKFENVSGSLDKYTFVGEQDDPLTFGCVYGVGYVYLHGKGKIKLPDGKEVRLGY